MVFFYPSRSLVKKKILKNELGPSDFVFAFNESQSYLIVIEIVGAIMMKHGIT